MRILPFGLIRNRSLGSPLLRKYREADRLWRDILGDFPQDRDSVQLIKRAQKALPGLTVQHSNEYNGAAYSAQVRTVFLPVFLQRFPLDTLPHEVRHIAQDAMGLTCKPTRTTELAEELYRLFCDGQSNTRQARLSRLSLNREIQEAPSSVLKALKQMVLLEIHAYKAPVFKAQEELHLFQEFYITINRELKGRIASQLRHCLAEKREQLNHARHYWSL